MPFFVAMPRMLPWQPVADPATIQTLLRQASRWTVAAEQDSNPLIAVLHANYGAAYIYALRQIASDMEVLQVTGYDPREVEAHILGVQDRAVRRFAPYVPEMLPDSPLAVIAGES
jgi:hypothetical protein